MRIELGSQFLNITNFILARVKLSPTEQIKQPIERTIAACQNSGKVSKPNYLPERRPKFMTHRRQEIAFNLQPHSLSVPKREVGPTFVALSASSRLLRAASSASLCAAIIFKFSLVPVCTERNNNALAILMLAC